MPTRSLQLHRSLAEIERRVTSVASTSLNRESLPKRSLEPKRYVLATYDWRFRQSMAKLIARHRNDIQGVFSRLGRVVIQGAIAEHLPPEGDGHDTRQPRSACSTTRSSLSIPRRSLCSRGKVAAEEGVTIEYIWKMETFCRKDRIRGFSPSRASSTLAASTCSTTTIRISSSSPVADSRTTSSVRRHASEGAARAERTSAPGRESTEAIDRLWEHLHRSFMAIHRRLTTSRFLGVRLPTVFRFAALGR